MRPWLLLLLLLLLSATPSAAKPRPQLTVFVASSLAEVLPKVAEDWAKTAGGCPVTFSTDASSRLARQLEQGAPADCIITADVAWMQWLEERELVDPQSRRALLGSRLVIVVPATDAREFTAVDQLTESRFEHVALAGEEVPAGKYAQAALEFFELYDALLPKVVRGTNVRATLAYVATSAADAGIVFRTDAQAEPRVRIAWLFAGGEHPAITYPGAVTSDSRQPELAAAFLEYCASDAAWPIFEAAGFDKPLAPPKPAR